jgi:hypothetical protein
VFASSALYEIFETGKHLENLPTFRKHQSSPSPHLTLCLVGGSRGFAFSFLSLHFPRFQIDLPKFTLKPPPVLVDALERDPMRPHFEPNVPESSREGCVPHRIQTRQGLSQRRGLDQPNTRVPHRCLFHGSLPSFRWESTFMEFRGLNHSETFKAS